MSTIFSIWLPKSTVFDREFSSRVWGGGRASDYMRGIVSSGNHFHCNSPADDGTLCGACIREPHEMGGTIVVSCQDEEWITVCPVCVHCGSPFAHPAMHADEIHRYVAAAVGLENAHKLGPSRIVDQRRT